MLVREKLPTSSVRNQIRFHSGFSFGGRIMHYNSFYKMFFIITLQFATTVSSFLKNFAFLTGIVIVCLQLGTAVVCLWFSLSRWRKLSLLSPNPYLGQWEENTNVYLLALSIWQRRLCGDMWSWVSKQKTLNTDFQEIVFTMWDTA